VSRGVARFPGGGMNRPGGPVGRPSRPAGLPPNAIGRAGVSVPGNMVRPPGGMGPGNRPGIDQGGGAIANRPGVGGQGTGAYAERILSTPGHTDGLFRPVSAGEPPSPLGPLVDQVQGEGYPGAATRSGKQLPYHGYFFRMLRSQGSDAPGGAKDYLQDGRLTGGFAFLAWPAVYGAPVSSRSR
jgi:hypothetical protein